MDKKFISIIWGYHEQIFSFEREQNYHMMPLQVMKEAGYACEIYALDSQVRIEDDPNFVQGTKVIYYSSFFQYLYYLFENRNARIYSNSLTLRTLLVGIIGKKACFYPHAYLFGSNIVKEYIIKFFYKFFSKIRVNNFQEKAEIDRIKKGLGVCVPLSLSSKFYKNNFNVSSTSAVFIGNLTKIKNPEYILESLTQLQEKGVNVHVHFIGEDRLDFGSIVESKGLIESVTLHGVKQPSEIQKILENATFYINCSQSEGQCLAAYESALAGKILLLPQSISFLPVFGNNAYYHRNPIELANMIRKLILNLEAERYKIIKNQEMILQNYSYDKLDLELKQLFLTI